MKYFFIFFGGIYFCAMAFANTADPADPNGRTAIYRSFELVPNQKLVLNLEISKKCTDAGKEQITLEDFESFKNYPSTQSGKVNSVRVKHYYVETFSPCENDVIGKITKQITIGPFKDRMTHIKLTTSENVTVKASTL